MIKRHGTNRSMAFFIWPKARVQLAQHVTGTVSAYPQNPPRHHRTLLRLSANIILGQIVPLNDIAKAVNIGWTGGIAAIF